MAEKGISLGAGYVSTDYQKCEYEGQKYYYHDGHWLNSAFVKVSMEEESRLNTYFHKTKKVVSSKKPPVGINVNGNTQNGKKAKKANKKRHEYKIDYDDRNFNDAIEHRIPGDFFRG